MLKTRINPLLPFGIILVFPLMMIGDPVIALTLIAAFALLLFLYTPKLQQMPISYTFLLLLGVLALGVGSIYILNVQTDPVYREANVWDISQYFLQFTNVGLAKYVKSFGLQLPLGLAGLYFLIKKKQKSLYEGFTCILLCVAIAGYTLPLILHIPLPGFRTLFPAIYLFNSACVLYAIEKIATKIRIKHAYTGMLIFYFSINIFSFSRSWRGEFQQLQEPLAHFAYIPVEIYEGLMFLRKAEPLRATVMASSATSMDLFIPGLTGKRTYSGHSLTTYRAKTRDDNSSKFFFQWTDGTETRELLKSNNIRYIFVTKYEHVAQDLKIYYPFLKVVYENPSVTIFRYDLD